MIQLFDSRHVAACKNLKGGREKINPCSVIIGDQW